MCSTAIGEEGLDIPEVNIVIFYEPIPSAIRAIQRAGRTARLMKGKLIILITKKTRDEAFFYVARSREKKMHSAIETIRNTLAKKHKPAISQTTDTTNEIQKPTSTTTEKQLPQKEEKQKTTIEEQKTLL